MHIFGKLVHIFGELVHIFGKLVNSFWKLVHIFVWKLVSRNFKTSSEKFGAIMAAMGFTMILSHMA